MAKRTFSGQRYSLAAEARGQEVILYREFGSYQGEWLLVGYGPPDSADPAAISGPEPRDGEGAYFFYKGWYGSCGGCDHFLADLGRLRSGDEFDPDAKTVREFVDSYPPFVAAAQRTVRGFLQAEGRADSILPANIRNSRGEVRWEHVCDDLALRLKLREGINLTAEVVLEAPNAELRREGMEAMGAERFLNRVHKEILDRVPEREEYLVRLPGAEQTRLGDGEPVVYLFVKDASSDRRYLLRVPPEMETVGEAKAWTFNLDPEQWDPVQET